VNGNFAFNKPASEAQEVFSRFQNKSNGSGGGTPDEASKAAFSSCLWATMKSWFRPSLCCLVGSLSLIASVMSSSLWKVTRRL